MNQTRMKQALSGVLCMVLIAATALGTTGCSQTKPEAPSDQSETTTIYSASEDPHQVGEGTVTFPFTVTDLEGGEVSFAISTDAETVGEALLEVGLITGEEGPYGMMVTIVNGQKLDYNEDKAYWGFYVDGAYAMAGVDETPIEAGKAYAFRAEPA